MTEIAHTIDLNLPAQLRDRSFRRKFFLAEASAWIAEQLIALRKRRGLSQKQVAELTNTQQPAISRAERADYQNWSFNTLRAIADALDARIRVYIEPYEDVLKEYESEDSIEAARAVAPQSSVVEITMPTIANVDHIIGAAGGLEGYMLPLNLAGIVTPTFTVSPTNQLVSYAAVDTSDNGGYVFPIMADPEKIIALKENALLKKKVVDLESKISRLEIAALVVEASQCEPIGITDMAGADRARPPLGPNQSYAI